MKSLALSSTARILVIVFQLINVKLYTSYLNAEQLGIFFFLLAVSYFANAFLFVPVDYYQQANLSKLMRETGGLRPLLIFNGKLVSAYGIISIALIIICFLIAPHYGLSALLVAALAISLYIVQALRNILNNLEHRDCVSFSFIKEAALKVCAFAFLAQLITPSEEILIFAWIVSLAVTTIYLVYQSYRYNLFNGVGTGIVIQTKDVVRFSYPFSIGAVFNWLQLQGYRLVLVPLGFTEEVGVFATLSSIGSAAIGAMSLIYSQQFMPIIYKTNGQYTTKYLKGAITLILAIALVAWGTGEFVVGLLTRTEFAPTWGLLLYGIFIDGANILIAALAVHMTLTADTEKIIFSTFIGVLAVVTSFGMMYWSSTISLMTIGIPLLFSQWIVVGYMLLRLLLIRRPPT